MTLLASRGQPASRTRPSARATRPRVLQRPAPKPSTHCPPPPAAARWQTDNTTAPPWFRAHPPSDTPPAPDRAAQARPCRLSRARHLSPDEARHRARRARTCTTMAAAASTMRRRWRPRRCCPPAAAAGDDAPHPAPSERARTASGALALAQWFCQRCQCLPPSSFVSGVSSLYIVGGRGRGSTTPS
jgi:hypothetical protein